MDPSARCIVYSDDVLQTESAIRLQKIFCYIRHGKINYKVYFFILYDKEYLHLFRPSATYVHFWGTISSYGYSIFHYNYLKKL
jgi:hypothetical protein